MLLQRKGGGEVADLTILSNDELYNGPIEKISKKEKLYQNVIKIFSAEIFIYAFSYLEPRLIAHFTKIWKCLNLLATFLLVVQILLLLLG